jgi:hypothetical protein
MALKQGVHRCIGDVMGGETDSQFSQSATDDSISAEHVIHDAAYGSLVFWSPNVRPDNITCHEGLVNRPAGHGNEGLRHQEMPFLLGLRYIKTFLERLLSRVILFIELHDATPYLHNIVPKEEDRAAELSGHADDVLGVRLLVLLRLAGGDEVPVDNTGLDGA